MQILQHAIDTAGGVGKLAKELGIAQNVVSNWKARERLPIAWSQLLELKYGKPTRAKRRPAAKQVT
jgi:hypothetical protein